MKTILVCLLSTWFAIGSCSLAGRSTITEISRHPSADGHRCVVQFRQDNGPTSHPGMILKLIPLVGRKGRANERTLLTYVGYHPARVRWNSGDHIVLEVGKKDYFKVIDQMSVACGKKIECQFEK